MRTPVLRASGLFFALCVPGFAAAVEYDCNVARKLNSETSYTAQDLEKWKFAVKIEERGEAAFLSRCLFNPGESKVTCNRYRVDKA